MNRRGFLNALAGAALSQSGRAAAERPNIVFILADDLGYGDLSCYNERSKISTPNLDRLARSGIRFTNAHTPSAVCTPTRYGLMTGRYAWRTRLDQGVLDGIDPPLIDKDRLTIASMLQRLWE
jgi:arylsulfatase A